MLRFYSPFEKLAFLHSNAAEQAQALMAEVQDLLPSRDTWVEVINTVLGAHIGPGVIGFACISSKSTGGIQ